MGKPTFFRSTSRASRVTRRAALSGVNRRKGSAVNIAPKLWGANWEVGYSYWNDKPDLGTVVAGSVTKLRGDSLYGWYKWGGLRVGLAWNRSKIDAATAAASSLATLPTTVEASNRNAWGIPVSYNWGAHNIYVDWYKARADKSSATTAGTVCFVATMPTAGISCGETKATFFGVTYAYDLSKRTSAAVSFTRINNGSAAAYGLFTQQQTIVFGEDPRFWGVTLQHRY